MKKQGAPVFCPRASKGWLVPKFTFFECYSPAGLSFRMYNKIQICWAGWLSAKDAGRADKFTVRSQKVGSIWLEACVNFPC